MDGIVHTFKARLVAKGFTQTYNVDYGETFSPLVDIRPIRILLAIAAFYDYDIWKIDVKRAFLNGHLSEDVYMVQPKGFVDPKHPNKECKLQRSIHGLNRSNVAFLVLYVDDILLMGNSVAMLQESAYLEKTLKTFRMENSKKGYTLMMEKPDCRKSQGVKTPTKEQHMVLVYQAKPEEELKVSCYADTSSQTDKDDIKFQAGYVFVLNGGAMDWKSAKQSTTAMSFIDAKYIAAAEASMEAVCMRKFIDGLGGVIPSNKRLMEILCEIILKKVHTDDNVADPFTKPMPLNKHFEHDMAIEIVPASSLM
ncbi:retrotransposon protein, putative, ty1-copia subclass [Tanacetum coccineum]|uniref:Retrotransposon protein, putative, ty1-copia subclass n=1 Tax=Tanacetum coccineum TaxID=301880 RepID=A0ABQ4XLQ1_9ASTR